MSSCYTHPTCSQRNPAEDKLVPIRDIRRLALAASQAQARATATAHTDTDATAATEEQSRELPQARGNALVVPANYARIAALADAVVMIRTPHGAGTGFRTSPGPLSRSR